MVKARPKKVDQPLLSSCEVACVCVYVCVCVLGPVSSGDGEQHCGGVWPLADRGLCTSSSGECT